jgi:hypothetical protein
VLLELCEVLFAVSAHEECLAAEIDDVAQATEPAMAMLIWRHPWAELLEDELNSGVIRRHIIQHEISNLISTNTIFPK